ncbi:MAG: hypothetical protein NWF01_09345 [Candidatus Bathyarchaeota archaeon]|nr:hypothetical protein [Candidatus Bathyarchaeota archaeon]
MSEFVYNKPVLSIFRERSVNPESDPFVVVRAKKLTVTAGEKPKYAGNIEAFFTLMGDVDYLITKEGIPDHYVVCWFDDTEPDMTKDLRRMRGVTFNGQVTCEEDPKTHKRTYNATFNAEHAKL